ncbi:GrpB family protein [Paenibacillus sp. YIM B09110]|uniref:GrpB family protein n=1 Tax=Paenibacillus sp. YIM B09110 TaxID=3126102 RepID=UPI00301DCCD0
MKDPVIIQQYNDEWPVIYAELRRKIIEQVGTMVKRIDHIGSTAVVGLAAKPIIDVQISVFDLNKIDGIKAGLEVLGYHHRKDNDDLTKRYFRESPEMRRTHIHVRQLGSWSEQFNLLFPDYLREHEFERNEYARVKFDLADQYRDQRERYVDGKTEIVWNIMLKANKWSQEIGWQPSKSDL